MRSQTLALALLLACGSGFAARAQQPPTPPVQAPPAVAPPPSVPPPVGPPPPGGPRRQRDGNPFAPPEATLHYAPDRDYDLQHVAITLSVDYPHRSYGGNVVDTVAPLRAEGLTTLKFDCGPNLAVTACTVAGQSATFTHTGDQLMVTSPMHIPQGKSVPVMITYNSGKSVQAQSFGQGDGGWHWMQTSGPNDKPDHIGFWTQGESDSNRNWVPTWDYPNDFTTTETIITVPKAWTVISNGSLVSDKDNDNGTHTVHWKMDLPHATYLISLCAGPFAVKTVNWEGVKLYYVAPQSDKDLLDSSFGNTPDMLSFYSKITGVKYAWPKYAQDAMYDFGGGMENVSATTLQESALTDARSGYYTMDSLNSHELGHQWFGDFVTCKDWGQIWLNESFATIMQIMYFEHSRGQYAYDREIEDNMQSYFNESRRYKRPIATHLYSNPDVMFDRHTYPKGGVVLHTLRKQIGDAAFFAGLHAYLTEHAHTPVESNDLCEAMTNSSGIDLQPFFEQWIYKPGHPVMDTTWAYDADAHQIVMTIKQTQDTSDGTPIYDLNPTIGIVANGTLTRVKTHVDQVTQEVRIPSATRPDAVLFDPDHDFLREIPTLHWGDDELPFILKYSPNAIDRTEAMRRLLAGTPSDAAIQAVADAVKSDTAMFPALDSIAPLGDLKREDLRPLFRGLLTHASFDRRGEAIDALGKLPATPEDTKTLRGLVNDKAPYAVVASAVTTLGNWDANANMDIIKQATQMTSRRDVIRAAAFAALAKANPATSVPILIQAAAATNPPSLRSAALRAMGSVDKSDEPTRKALLGALLDPNNQIVFSAAAALGNRHDTDALPALQALQANPPVGSPDFFGQVIDQTIQQIQNPDAPAPRRFRFGGGG